MERDPQYRAGPHARRQGDTKSKLGYALFLCRSRSSRGAPGFHRAGDGEGAILFVNNITAKRSEDGSVEIQFGGCDGKIPNCLPITKGWNYTVRLYRPRPEILDGSWKFPEAEPMK